MPTTEKIRKKLTVVLVFLHNLLYLILALTSLTLAYAGGTAIPLLGAKFFQICRKNQQKKVSCLPLRSFGLLLDKFLRIPLSVGVSQLVRASFADLLTKDTIAFSKIILKLRKKSNLEKVYKQICY